MDYRERGSYARGVYPTQDTSRMGTARVKRLLLLYTKLNGLSRCEDVAKYRITRGTSSTDCTERGSHARGVYPKQYTSHMGTARMKEEEGADTRIIVKE